MCPKNTLDPFYTFVFLIVNRIVNRIDLCKHHSIKGARKIYTLEIFRHLGYLALFIYSIQIHWVWTRMGFVGGSVAKFACQHRRHRFDPWVVPWRWKWQPTPAFLPGKSHGQRSLVDYSPWGSQRGRHDWPTKWQQQMG